MDSAINTSYAEQARGFAGMLANSKLKTASSYVQGEASAEMQFGIAVAQGTASAVQGTPDKAILMVDANSKVVGVHLHSHSFAPEYDMGTTGVKPKRLISVLEEGEVYMLCESDCTKGNAAFVRHTANGLLTNIGAVRKDGDTNTAVEYVGIIFDETLAAGGIVRVKVDVKAARAIANI